MANIHGYISYQKDGLFYQPDIGQAEMSNIITQLSKYTSFIPLAL